MVRLTAQAIRNLARRYQKGGWEAARYEKQRPGAAAWLDASQKQRIIAMVCSDPPTGRARWTVRLVAQEAIQRKLGHGWGEKPSGFCSWTTTSSRGGKKMWWCAGMNRHGGVSSEGWRIQWETVPPGQESEPCSLDSQEEGN